MEEAIQKADVLIEALPYIQNFAGRPVVIKFGGSAMEQGAVLRDVLEDVVFLAAARIQPIVVHGGGPQISRAMEEAGLSPRFIHGHRFTDAEALKVVVEVLVNQVNERIVELMRRLGGNARSTFTDGRSMLRGRRQTLRPPAEDAEPVDLGYVGEVVEVEAEAMLEQTARGTILAVPPIAQDESGQLYNVNADTAAAAVAGAVEAEKIVFLSDVHGIMAEPGDQESLLSTVSEDQVERMVKEQTIRGGMLPKTRACIAALEAGVHKAHIIDGRLPHSLLLEIFTDEGVGTQILK